MSAPPSWLHEEEWRGALDTAVRLAPGRCPDESTARLETLQRQVDERLGRGDALTVAAMVGGTGVGKSALVNGLAGTEVVAEGVRRPTTDVPVAIASVLDPPTARLLDWLGIDDRRQVAGALPEGLVLVDLPDHDSVVTSHRHTSERLAARVDVVVLVVDALKYARADLHEGALADLTAHAEVLVVALNRSDELPAEALAEVREDLVVRLAADGLGEAVLHTTSALTGAGVEGLLSHLAELASTRTAAARRLAADATVIATAVLAATPELPPMARDASSLVDATLAAVDADGSLDRAVFEQQRLARGAVRSPIARAVRVPGGLLRSAARALGLYGGTGPSVASQATPRAQHELQSQLARVVDLGGRTATEHTRVAASLEHAATRAAPRLVAEVSRCAGEVATLRRRWWPVLAIGRGLAEAAVLVGLLWQLLLGTVVWLGLPALPLPMATDELSWPAALLLGGLAVRVSLGLLSRLGIRISSNRLRRRARRQLRDAVTGRLERDLIAPYEEEVRAVGELRAALQTLR